VIYTSGPPEAQGRHGGAPERHRLFSATQSLVRFQRADVWTLFIQLRLIFRLGTLGRAALRRAPGHSAVLDYALTDGILSTAVAEEVTC